MITIQNQNLIVDISEQGAEVQSIRRADTGHEYLWQGDANYWGGRSPILFPAVGGLWNGTFRHLGKEYAMPKHGFAKGRLWEALPAADDTGTCATFRFLTTEDDLAVFPFRCEVLITYSLDDWTLNTDFAVRNLGDDEAYFQIGGHPAFSFPHFSKDRAVSGYMRLHTADGEVPTVVRAGAQGCTGPERFAVPMEADGLVPVRVETFANEALIFDELQVDAVELLDAERRPMVRVESDAPVWLFWQPQGLHSPFVCTEPWYGLCDPQGFDGQLHERPYINCVEPHGVCSGLLWRAEFL